MKKAHQCKVGKCFLQVCKLRALSGPLYGKITFLCFTCGTGKVEIDLRQKTEKMVCVKDVYTQLRVVEYLCVMMNEI